MPTGLGDEEIWLCPSLDDSADDLSGNGNHGTYNGGMGTVADTSEGGSRAYDFDGINDYLSIPAIGALSSWSVSAWCYFDATGSGRTILTNDKSGWNDDVLIGISPEGSTFQPVNTISATHQDSNNQVRTTVSDSTTASTGTWYHLTITSDGSALKCYVDGTLENTTSRNGADLTFGNNNVYLGNDAENTGSRRLDGRLDDIRIFDRALSDTEITHLATSRGMQGNPYQFNGLGDEKLWLCPTLNDSADDLSGNGNHGTYNGGMGTVSDANNGGVKAYSFDGTDDFINCGRSIDTTAPLSVSCWFNSDQVRNFQGLVSRSAGSSFPNFILYTHGSSEVGTYISAHRRTSSLVATGNWYHTCFTLDANGNLDLYFNGSLVRSDTSVSMSYSAAFDLLIGDFQSATGSDYPHDGLMDDIRIFGRVLSETEIDHLGTSRGIEGNPYQFNGLGDEKLWLCPSLNDSADDLSGNGNHGAYTGTIATVADTSNGGVRAYEIGTATGYIDLDRPSGIADVVAPLSISCWIYINGNNSMKTIWGAYQSTWSGYLYSLLRIDSDYLTYFSVSTGGAYISKQESSSYSQQTWFHIAVTMDSSGNIKFYRNGTLATTDQFTNLGLSYPLQSSVKFYLGANQAQTNSEHFEGRIDDFRWFGDVLTEDEITALASKRGYRNLTGPHPHPLTVAIEHPLG